MKNISHEISNIYFPCLYSWYCQWRTSRGNTWFFSLNSAFKLKDLFYPYDCCSVFCVWRHYFHNNIFRLWSKSVELLLAVSWAVCFFGSAASAEEFWKEAGVPAFINVQTILKWYFLLLFVMLCSLSKSKDLGIFKPCYEGWVKNHKQWSEWTGCKS